MIYFDNIINIYNEHNIYLIMLIILYEDHSYLYWTYIKIVVKIF